ncbi:MAG: YraN family protein [Halocynthiibacter sp.]
MNGLMNYHAGMNAEHSVERHYNAMGFECLERRWRGKSGEVDLIMSAVTGLVFIEVKTSKTHARAFEALGARQLARIFGAVDEYVSMLPLGLATPCRVDVAAVDDTGRVAVVENVMPQ